MARRTKKEAEQTRESILIAALDLFAEKGFAQTTMSDIAKHIGMTRGAIYWHFENKQDLFSALTEFVDERNDPAAASIDLHTLADLRKAFIAYARLVAEDDLVRKFEYFTQFKMEWSPELLRETHDKLYETKESPIRKLEKCIRSEQVASLLKENVDHDQLVLTLISFWQGASFLFFGGYPFDEYSVLYEKKENIGDGGFSLVKAIGDGFDLIMNGVLKEENKK